MLRHDYLKVFAIGVAYYLAHKIAFFFPDQEKVIMLVWPAGGVSLAAFLLNPRRLWPALTLAFYISGITADVLLAGRSFMTGVGYMTANMVESIGCAWLILQWSGGFRRFTQVKEILALIAGTIFVNALSSCIGAGTSVLTRGASFVDSWQSWYISDGLGVLLMGPFIVAWINIKDLIVRFRLKVLIEGLCFLIVWSVVIWLIFAPIIHPIHLRPYILIPLLAWPAIRFGQRGVTLALMVLFAMAIASPPILSGPSIWKMLSDNLANRLLELQLFLLFSASVGYLLSAGYTGLVQADEELKMSNERLELALKGANEGIWDWNITTGYVSYSNLWVEMIGYKPGELKPDVSTWEQLLHPDDRNKSMEALNKHFEDDRSEYKAEFRLKCKDGSWKWIQALGKVFQRDTDGKPERMSGIHLDITDRKLEAQQVANALSFTTAIVEASPLGILTYKASGECLLVNLSAVEITGGSVEKLLEQNFRQIESWKKQGLILPAEEALRTGEMVRKEVYGVTTFGKEIWYEAYFQPFIINNESHLLLMLNDIRERRQAEDVIKRSLEEKEVMLKEIHHRVKNNMQVISSLLSLQAKGVADSTVKAMLEESRNRVSSMSLVHEKLYQSKDLAYIDFKDYLQSLVAGIANTYKRHDVVISVDMEPVALDVNVGIPCGLIVNELVSNSLKHAFPDGRKGTISLGINKNSEGNYVLFVADNGIGLPGEVDFRNTSTLGLQLVKVLTGQIHGTIELSREEGTRFSITFPGTSKS